MAKYLIHAMPKRMWYVKDYLIPSLLYQGIAEEDISVYNDEAGEGNLIACMKAFASVPNDLEGTWHLQDDVVICKDFKQRTENYDTGLVCGFASELYDGDIPEKRGAAKRAQMWFSFPCIRIPNKYARGCAEWVNKYIINNPIYEDFWGKGTNDDWCFRQYLKEFHPDCVALNIVPNLVDHVDYLIGGGTGKKEREVPVRAQYWEDDDIVKKLEKKLEQKNKKGLNTKEK